MSRAKRSRADLTDSNSALLDEQVDFQDATTFDDLAHSATIFFDYRSSFEISNAALSPTIGEQASGLLDGKWHSPFGKAVIESGWDVGISSALANVQMLNWTVAPVPPGASVSAPVAPDARSAASAAAPPVISGLGQSAIGPGSPSLALDGTSVAPGAQVGTGLSFTLNNVGGVTHGSQAEVGFLAAAALWSSYLGDPVNVRLNVGFSPLGASILGQTGSNTRVVSYAAVRSRLIADQASASDSTAVAHLQAGPSLSFVTNNSAGTRILDNDGSANNTYLDVSTANLRALGITVDANGTAVDDGVTADASITFNSSFTFDFNPADGISPGAIDFVGVAFHEIGHALGFFSGVDTVDYYSGSGPGAPLNLNPYAIFSVLDLYRYSLGAVTPVADLSYGGTTYFSINGGATNLGLFSTGSFQGDGRQASHWKDNLGLGIMDPTSAPAGQANVITSLDIQAMDVIGWNLASSSGTATITIDDVAVTEGNAGTTTATFTVSRTGGGAAAFAVNYATANGAATAGSDYVATSGTLSFGTSVNTQTISVTINGDTAIESNETFFVNLSGATNGATISDSQGQGTITNDDAPDDYADNLSDATSPLGQVSVGGSSTGNLEIAGDHDWFQAQLTSGITYVVQLQGSGHGAGTLYDPYLRVYNGSSVLQTSNDDSGGNLDSYLTFTPSTSATYYIDAAAYGDFYAGTYRVSLASIQPDLDLYDNMTASATTVAPGASTTLGYYVVNFGNAAVGASTTGFYLSTDANITTGDTLLGTRSAPALTANGGATWYDFESQTVTLPGNLAVGTYYLGAIADYNNAVTNELTEANNASNAVQIAVQQPDLDLYNNMTVSNAVVGAGGSTTLSYYVVNFSDAAVGASTTGFYLSTDANITTADTLLTTRSAPALTGYGGAMWYDYESQTVTLPGNLAPGTYYLGAISDYNNAITESDESNNASNAVQVTIPQPDLDLYDNMTVSSAVVGAGGSTTLSYYVVNFGLAPVGASTTGFYLSTDANITTGDTLLTTRSAPALTANGGAMWYDYESQTVVLPGNLAPGTYYLGAISDYTNAINESNEVNNASNAVQITVPQPDLDLYDNMTVSNAVVGAGDSTTLSYYVVNFGQAAVGSSITGFYLSTDNTISTSDTLLTTRTAPALGPDINQAGSGWYDYESQTVTLPGNLAPGTYYVGAIADYNNAVTNEITEANNPSNAVAITVTPPPQPDLAIHTNLTASSTSVAAGGSTTLSYYVVNWGQASVGSSITGFYLSTDNTISTSDTLLTTKTAPGLGPDINQAGSGWYDFESMTVTLPGNLAPGTYYLGAIADYNNAVTNEITEANNASNAVQITVPQPDLDLYDNMTASATTLAAGASTTLSYYVVNFGLAPVGASTTGFYLSTDADITTADTLLTTRSAPALTDYGGAMWYDYESQTVMLPGNLAPGTYYLGAISDYNNAVTNEITEANNASNAVQITIGQADLDLYDNVTVSNAAVAAGGSTTLSFYVVNFSDAAVGASTTGFYLSTDANITTGDTLLTTRSAPELTGYGGAMWYDYESQTVVLPGDLAPGTYYLGAIADYADAVAELNEVNNASNAVQITVASTMVSSQDFGLFNDSLSVGSIGASSASSVTGWQDVDATALGNSWLQDPASSSGSLLGPVGNGYVDGQGQPDLSQFVTADAAGAQFRPQPVV